LKSFTVRGGILPDIMGPYLMPTDSLFLFSLPLS
jgi:hypothetical protein